MKTEKKTILRSELPLYTANYGKRTQRELFERNFKLIKILSGHALLSAYDRQLYLETNTYAFVTPGGFSKIKMYPERHKPFRLMCLNFNDLFLEEYRRKNTIRKIQCTSHLPCFETIKTDPWLDAVFASLNYYTQEGNLPDEQLIHMKLTECLYVLKCKYHELYQGILQHSIGNKTDLQTFMTKNYMHNAPLERFAELSGRSLSTFRRDFQNFFGMQPHKWILQKRLETAYKRIVEYREKPSDIFWELGFETLAHFSRKFKEHYGYAPSKCPAINDEFNT